MFISISLLVALLSLSACHLIRESYERAQTKCLHFSTPSVEVFSNPEIYELYPCVHPERSFETGRVIRVIDGDSILVRLDGQDFEVRYIGINTPEYRSEERAAAILATQANEEMLFGEKVLLFKDVSETDKFGRLLRYVFTDEAFINYEMVRMGFAESRAYPPDTSCQSLFDQRGP